jgi:hypothetical protein
MSQADRVRVYLPATHSDIRSLVDDGVCSITVGYTVTDGLRGSNDGVTDEEELEFLALVIAAGESARGQSMPARRVVLAVDVDASGLIVEDEEAGRIRIDAAIPRTRVASAHVDAHVINDPEAGADDLMWFANQEFEMLLEEDS